jgi:hypothetical protein
MGSEGALAVDLDNPATWPEPVAAWVRAWAERPGSLEDMWGGTLIERDDELRSLLAGPQAAHTSRACSTTGSSRP